MASEIEKLIKLAANNSFNNDSVNTILSRTNDLSDNIYDICHNFQTNFVVNDLSANDVSFNNLWVGGIKLTGQNSGGGVTLFTGLTDTPNSYTDKQSKLLRVNSTGNGLEFTTDITSSNAGDIATNSGDIATNSGDIATNTSSIATNTSSIATNVSSIATNTSSIATNVSDISDVSQNIIDLSGTVDANIASIATNTGNISTNTSKIGITTEQASAITANTAKTGITTEQASAITANTAKTGITTGQASAITANTAKTGITTEQASAITANTAKVVITTGQASAITANTAKTGITTEQASAITANTAKTGITTGQASAISANTVDIGTNTSNIATNVSDISDVSQNVIDLSGAVDANIIKIATNISNISTNTSTLSNTIKNSGNQTINGVLTVTGDLSANDASFNKIYIDTINEKTDASGVTIDSVLLKDQNVTAHTISAQNYAVGGTNFISASRQGNFRDLEVKDTNNSDTILLTGDGGHISIDGTLSADTISEKTSGSGVTIDSVLLKDQNVTAHTISAQNYAVGSTNFISSSRQGNFRDLEVKSGSNNVTMLITGDTGDMSLSGDISGNDASFNAVDIHTLNLTNALSPNSLPKASTSTIGGIQVGSNLSIDENGILEATDTNTTYSVGDNGLTKNNFTDELKTKLDGIPSNANYFTYNLPKASTSTIGGIQVGSNLSINENGILEATYSVGDNGLTKNNFTDELKTKLNSIETGADVTDTANVTAAGALMNSEVTDLAGIKTVTISNLQVKLSEGAFVNGDKTKLDGISLNANNYALPTTITVNNVTVNNNGKIGIGSPAVTYPLEVDNKAVSVGTSGSAGYLNSSGGTSTTSSYNAYWISIKAAGGAIFMGSYIFVASDKRIKENITEVPDNLSLQKLRDISCSYYEYKDKINRENSTTIGFIAQQVREHMPMAVSLQKEIIPNEMRDIQNPQWTVHTTDPSGNNTYKLTIPDLEDVSGNTKYRFYSGNDPSGNDECKKEIYSMENDPKSFIFEEKWNKVFLYGKEVDDFHTLDKQKLFALNFSATQEIDKNQIILQQKVADLESQNTNLLTRLEALEKKVSDAGL